MLASPTSTAGSTCKSFNDNNNDVPITQAHHRHPRPVSTTTLNPCWTRLTEGYLHAGIRRLVVCVGTWSATYPLTTVIVTCVTSLALLMIGFVTNFQLELNQLHFVTPTNSLPDVHSQWIQNTGPPSQRSGFPNVRVFYLNVHNHGDNVLHAQAMQVALEAMEALQSTKNYQELCQTCKYCTPSDKTMLFDGSSYCRISSVTQFWNHSLATFLEETQTKALGGNEDAYIRHLVSNPTYPDGTPVYHEAILGKYEGYNITSGEDVDYTNAPPLSLATLMDMYTSENNNKKDRSLATLIDVYTAEDDDFQDANDNATLLEVFTANDDDVADGANDQNDTTATALPDLADDDKEANNMDETTTSTSADLEVRLTSAQCLAIKLDIPDVGTATDDFESDALERLSKLQAKYQSNDSTATDSVVPVAVQLEYFTMNGYQYEMMRAMFMDFPLVAVLIVVMVAFAMLIFSDRHDRVQSRGMVGLYSFTTIGLSLFTGYGIMWCIGVPLTTVATLIPFVVCGVGLDDTFIITGTYFRLLREEGIAAAAAGAVVEKGDQLPSNNDNKKDTAITAIASSRKEQQQATTLRIVQTTLNEVAVSITMTTVTTLIAFITGGTSRIPAVRWLCWYAAISLFVVYLYQITCFIALLVLDQRRVEANRKDLCIWMVINDDADSDADEEISEEEKVQDKSSTTSTPPSQLGVCNDDHVENTDPDHAQEEDKECKSPPEHACDRKKEITDDTIEVTVTKDDDIEEEGEEEARDRGSTSMPPSQLDAGDDDENNNQDQGQDEDKESESLPDACDKKKEITDLTVEVTLTKDDDMDEEDLLVENKSSESLSTAAATKATETLKARPSAKHLEKSFPERLMAWYADRLLKPVSKIIVLVVFAIYFGGTVYSTTLLHQEFNIEDYIPDDSFMTSSMRAYNAYSSYLIYIEVYFRYVFVAGEQK